MSKITFLTQSFTEKTQRTTKGFHLCGSLCTLYGSLCNNIIL